MAFAVPEPTFYLGEVVTLRGQGQFMTVESICECGIIHVVWFSGSDDTGWTLHRDSFDADMLDSVDE